MEGMENAGAVAATQGGGGGGTRRQWRLKGGSCIDGILVARVRSGSCHGGGGGDGGWTPSPAFCEQPLEREETPFFS